jgi:hypothetical protein
VNPVPKTPTRIVRAKTTGSDGVETLSGWEPSNPRPEPFAYASPEEVRDLSQQIGHTLRPAGAPDQLDRGGWPGKFHASHAEKQLAVVSPNDSIAVSQKMCPDCRQFFGRLAEHRQTTQVVSDPQGTWIFRPDGTSVHVPPGLELLSPAAASIWPPLAVGGATRVPALDDRP